jgi:DNA-binding transcriptional regulator WhiA
MITEGVAELIGVIIGDGHIYRKNRKYQIGIVGNSKTDLGYFEKLKKLISAEWNKEVKIKPVHGTNAIRIVFDSKEICNFLINDMNIYHGRGKCQKVKIPKEIYENWDLAKHTVRGIFDTDGSIFVSKKPGIEKYPCMEITTTSKNLVYQLKSLLNKNRFRVALRIEKRKNPNPNALPSYRLALNGKENLKKWIEEISFTNPYKLNRALNYLNN